VGVGSPLHEVEEGALEFLGDRAASARADLGVIDGADRSHLDGGAGEEQLVGGCTAVRGR